MIKKITALSLLILISALPLAAKGNVPDDPYTDGASLAEPGIYAKINTEKGPMIFSLDYKDVPLTVLNFINVAGKGFYNNQTFYREIENYALFAGDPEEKGISDMGYNYPMEENGTMSHDGRGVLSMDGVSGMSNGSRFFISLSSDPVLDGKYTAFGRLVEGNAVLAKMKRGMKIESVEIIRTGSDAEAFDTGEEEFARLSKAAMDLQLESFRADNPQVVAAIENLGEGIQKSLTGIYYKIGRQGNGTKPAAGDTVSVHYTALLVDGTVFDSSVSRGTPFEFQVGTQSVIPGWDESILSMSVGEQRVVIIPPNLGYGNVKTGPIPANSWLMFQIELLGIK